MPLTVVSEQGTAGVHIVRPAGSLDSNTSPILEDHLAGLRRDGATAFVLDLKDLTYISSAGVRVVLAARKAMKAAGGDVALMNLQPQIRKVFEIIQALPSLSVFQSVSRAGPLPRGHPEKSQGGRRMSLLMRGSVSSSSRPVERERTRTWYRALESGTEAAKYARE